MAAYSMLKDANVSRACCDVPAELNTCSVFEQTSQVAECENCSTNTFAPTREGFGGFHMSNFSKQQILVVDDDPAVRDSLVMLLQSSGYAVSTAIHGFDALLQLKRSLPAIVLSDLNMPQMSGFELLSVLRRRFPQISVIAMSGAYHSGDAVPGGVIADAFYSKGQGSPETLLQTVADLIRISVAHAVDHQRQSAPVWIPRNGKDSHGIPYVVLTCTECLRSFPLSVMTEDLQKVQETPACSVPIRSDISSIFLVQSLPRSPNLGHQRGRSSR
jgi:CheY-like chemotaxis protein